MFSIIFSEPITLKPATTRPNLPSWTLPTTGWTPHPLNSTNFTNSVTEQPPTTPNPDLYSDFDKKEVIVKPPIVSPIFLEAINGSKNHMLPIFTTEKEISSSTTKRPLSIVVNNFTQYCPADRSRGLAWNWTLAGEVAVVQCPQGSTGKQSVRVNIMELLLSISLNLYYGNIYKNSRNLLTF